MIQFLHCSKSIALNSTVQTNQVTNQKVRFQPKKDYLIAYVLGATNLLMLVVLIINPLFNKSFGIAEIIISLTCFLPLVLLMFDIYKRTYYEVKNGVLTCRSSVFVKRIPVDKIASIVKSNSPIVGWRLALAQKGLIITYNRFDEVYISPENVQEFCAYLKQLNPNIRIQLY